MTTFAPIRRLAPEVDLKPFFDELVFYLTENSFRSDPLLLLDLVEMGCIFPDGFKIMENEAPAKEDAEQPTSGDAEQGAPKNGE